MKTLADIQKRLRSLGEIRMGTKGDKGQPVKLQTWRLTSPDKSLIEQAAALWGGTVQPWKSPTGDEWQVITDRAEIPVCIAPMDGMQAYEEWSAAGLAKRCDGEECLVPGAGGMKTVPCTCDPEKRACKLTTRFSVILPDLPALGVWKVESHGFYAASELPGFVESLGNLARLGKNVKVLLGIENRERKTPGQPIKKFTVPYLKPLSGVPVGALLGVEGYAPSLPMMEDAAPALPSAPARQIDRETGEVLQPQLPAGPSVYGGNADSYLFGNGLSLDEVRDIRSAGISATNVLEWKSKGIAGVDGIRAAVAEAVRS